MTEQAKVTPLADWLISEAERRMKESIDRRPSDELRNATEYDLKQAHRMAETMAGRKLPKSTMKDHRDGCDMQDRIADKLEREARQIHGYADQFAALEASLASATLEIALLRDQVAELKRERDEALKLAAVEQKSHDENDKQEYRLTVSQGVGLSIERYNQLIERENSWLDLEEFVQKILNDLPKVECGQKDRDARLLEICTDNQFIYYGPYPCTNCRQPICKLAEEQGGETFDYPQGPIYPNTNWTIHTCTSQMVTDSLTCPFCGHAAHLSTDWTINSVRIDKDTCEWGSGNVTCNCPHQMPRIPMADLPQAVKGAGK